MVDNCTYCPLISFLFFSDSKFYGRGETIERAGKEVPDVPT